MMSNQNFAEQVITEVKKRELLWNKWNEGHNNRLLTDREWESVAAALERDKEEVKQKWRNLRDQFQRELRKVKMRSNGELAPYTGKWCHFLALEFLKEIMVPRLLRIKTFENNHDTAKDNEENDEDANESWKVHIKEDFSSPQQSDDQHSDDEIYQEPEIAEIQAEYLKETKSPIEVTISPAGNYHHKQIKRKRKAELEVETFDAIKRNCSSSRDENDDGDEDEYFVKSLVPFMKKLTPVRKLIVRNEMQSLLIRELMCEKCRTNGPQDYCRCRF